jgi:hypothetical protein
MKKWIFGFLSLFFISVVSAISGYSNFSFYSFFNNFMEYLPYIFIFLAIFWVFYYLLKKSGFLPNDGVVAVISIAISAFALYGVQKSGFLIEDFFSGFGFSREFLFDFFPWIVLIAAMVIVWKWGFGMLLMIFGSLFFFMGVFGIAYESELNIFLGIILIFLGLWRYHKWKKKKKYKEDLNALDLDKREAFKKSRKLEQKMKRRKMLEKIKMSGKSSSTSGGLGFFGKFRYKPGMRRGGEKVTKSRFVK